MLLAATRSDLAFLGRTLVDAAYRDRPPTDRDPLADPAVARYLAGWGRPGDHGLVAWHDGEPVGAAWTRIFPAEDPGYGFVAPDVPELTIAVHHAHRGIGIGRALLVGVLDQAAAAGVGRVSLSVADADNPVALALYRRCGFDEVGRDPGGSLTMVRGAAPGDPTAPAPPAPDAGTAPVARLARPDEGPALLRLREVMQRAMGLGGDPAWPEEFLRTWADGVRHGWALAAVVDGDEGRPIASAIATLQRGLPGPARPDGLDALVSSVATEPRWRRRGAASACVAGLQDALVARGRSTAHLTAYEGAEGTYLRLGFTPRSGLAMRWRA